MTTCCNKVVSITTLALCGQYEVKQGLLEYKLCGTVTVDLITEKNAK
jgi:hypothetical protein